GVMVVLIMKAVNVRSGNVMRSHAVGWPPVAAGLATCLVSSIRLAEPAPEALQVPSPEIVRDWNVARFSRSAPIESSAVASVVSHSRLNSLVRIEPKRFQSASAGRVSPQPMAYSRTTSRPTYFVLLQLAIDGLRNEKGRPQAANEKPPGGGQKMISTSSAYQRRSSVVVPGPAGSKIRMCAVPQGGGDDSAAEDRASAAVFTGPTAPWMAPSRITRNRWRRSSTLGCGPPSLKIAQMLL